MTEPGAHGCGEEGTEGEARLLEPGVVVDNFKVLRPIGRGGMGEVYLARDTLLGRKVALKVIRSDAVSDERAVERFLLEARITARFNHPHIVAIHSVGDVRGLPYVALEHLEGGGTLRQRMLEETPSVREAIRIGLAIAEALVEAHRHDVLHRDLKPENVLIPSDGRLRVLDFGLARALAGPAPRATPVPGETGPEPADPRGHAPSGLVGTPLYMAPEQWAQSSCSPATDVWALGVILYEMIAGRLPFEASSALEVFAKATAEPHPPLPRVRSVPPELAELVDLCLEKEPASRPPAAEVVSVLRGLLQHDRKVGTGRLSPFRGLLPFTERDADLFFGRDAEVAEFVERLRQEAVLPVVGPSGAGKSSFVRAGVIPRLRDQGSWVVLHLRPGAMPFTALSVRLGRGETDPRPGNVFDLPTVRSGAGLQALSGSGERTPWAEGVAEPGRPLADQLLDSPGLLALLLHRVSEVEGARVLLFVDQLEELFALPAGEAEGGEAGAARVRRAFMEAVCGAADDPQGPVRVVFTLRDDFLVRLAETDAARRALSSLTLLRSPGPEALREILERPLELVGYGWEDRELPAEMVRAVGAEPACLPALQLTCSKLWERRDRQRQLLTREAYEALGGVEGGLARHADDVFAALSPEEERLARLLLLRLVTPEGTRRTLPRAQLLGGLDEDAEAVLGRLVNARTVTVRRGRRREDGEAAFELVHESLITRWDRLARWIDESREEVSFLAEVSEAADLWDRRGRPEEEVWRGAALHEALARASRCDALPEPVERFLAAGERVEARRVGRRRLAIVAVIASLVAALSVFAALAASSAAKEREARRQRDVAEAQTAEAQREGAAGALERGDLLEARAKLRRSLETGDSPLSRALWWRLGEEPEVFRKRLPFPVYALALSPDGRTIATGCPNGGVYLLDASGLEGRTLRGEGDQVLGVAFSPDGALLAASTTSGDIGLWDLEAGGRRTLRGHDGRVWGVAFSPDGARLASAGYDGSVRLWDLASGEGRVLAGRHEGCAWAVAFSPDGRRLASGGCDGLVRLWDGQSGEAAATLEGHGERVQGLEFSPDGALLASASRDRTVRLWDLAAGRARAVLGGDGDRLRGVSISRDGRRVAASGDDGAIRVFDVASGREERVLRGHTAWTWAVRFGPDPEGRHLYSGGHDKTIRLWDLGAGEPARPLGGHEGRGRGVSFSPDGRLLASSGDDGTIRLWDVDAGEVRRVLRGPTGGAWSVAFSPDGRLLASNGQEESLLLWDVETGEVRRTLEGHVRWAADLAFSPDGRLVASGGLGDTVRLWDVATGSLRLALEGHEGAVAGVAFDPEGARLASGGLDGTVRLWDAATGEALALLRGGEGCVSSIAFAAAGSALASAGCDGAVRLWDLPSGGVRVLGRHEGPVYRVRVERGGRGRVGTASADRTARLWDVSTGETVVLRGHGGEVNGFAWSRDGSFVATASDDGTVRVWGSATGEPRWRTVAVLPGAAVALTQAGWTPLAAGGRAPEAGRAFARALEERGRTAEAAGGDLCAATADGRLELWDMDADARRFGEPVEAVDRVLPFAGGCLALAGERLLLADERGATRELAVSVSAVSVSGDELVLCEGGRLVVLDAAGGERETHPVDEGCTAAARVGGVLWAGFGDGRLEAPAGSPRPPALTSPELPESAVTRLLEGPMATLVAGYGDGTVAVWSLETGRLLRRARLHGPVTHLSIAGERLLAASALGQALSTDLGVFYRDRCEVLRQVWRSVPVTWEGGAARLRAPPPDHPCAAGSSPRR